MEKNVFIFDLYGTLIDIRTDEEQESLWKMLAECYQTRGVNYKPIELEERYQTLVNEETGCLRALTRNHYAEIELSHVFGRLLYEHPAYDPARDPITNASSIQEVDYQTERIGLSEGGNEITFTDPDNADLSEKYDPWIIELAQKFRETSRSRLKVYPDTIPVLSQLKNEGKKIYLLSNAQTLFTLPEMEACEILDYFDGIFISSEQKIKKPAKLFMERLLRDFDIDQEEAVMIGNDMTSDMRVAMESGMTGVFLNTDGYSEDQIAEALAKQKEEFANEKIRRGERSEGEESGGESFEPYVIFSGNLSEMISMLENEK